MEKYWEMKGRKSYIEKVDFQSEYLSTWLLSVDAFLDPLISSIFHLPLLFSTVFPR